ncbi:hypothetical protein ABZ741_39055 [Streptomyces globisporus]|uniref:hypothetical protein n=1 Tax=Streptomyces globisporus TaxID=1908 RepID=UPI003460A04B
MHKEDSPANVIVVSRVLSDTEFTEHELSTSTNDDGTALSKDSCQLSGYPSRAVVPAEVSGPLLTSRSALILVAAVVLGGIVGVLTYFSTGNTATAMLAGLAGAGASTPVLHTLIGR